MIVSVPAIPRKRRSGTVTRRRLRSQPRRSMDSLSPAEHARTGAGYPRIQPPSEQDCRFPSPIRPSPAVTSLPPIAVAHEPTLADRELKGGGPSVLFGGSRRFPRRPLPRCALGLVSDRRTLPSPHPSRSGGSRSGASLGALLDAEQLRQDSGVGRIVSRTRGLLQPDDGVVQELRDDAAGEGLDGLPLGRREPGELGAEPGKLRGSDLFPPRSRRARMSGARRSERLRTANRRTSSSTMPFAAAMSSDRWAAPSATVARSPSISTRRRPETSVTESSISSGDRCRGSLRVRDDLTQGSRTSSPRRSTRSVVRGRSRCAARAGGRNRSRTS